MTTSDKALVATITRSRVFREYEAAFRAATGLPLAFTPPETWGLPLREDPNAGSFCRLMAQTSKSCAACLEMQAKLNEQANVRPATLTCAFGLHDSAVPVKLGERLLGYLRTGQVFLQAPTEETYSQVLQSLARLGIPVQADELRRAYFACKVMPPDQYQAVVALLKLFAEHLGSVSNHIIVAEETAESPQITRVKEFIAQHMADDIGLADCARAAHVSTFYFCKMFRRATGLSFTEYLARLRIEKARDRLLDTHARVSEVAFEVGFQSLSQFNRSFKRIVGQSPTEYRAHLAVSKNRNERPLHAAEAPVNRLKFSPPAPGANRLVGSAAGR